MEGEKNAVLIRVDRRETPQHLQALYEKLTASTDYEARIEYTPLEVADVHIHIADPSGESPPDLVIEIKWTVADLVSTLFSPEGRGTRQLVGLVQFPRRIMMVNDPRARLRTREMYPIHRRLGTIQAKYGVPVRILHGSTDVVDDISGLIRSFMRRTRGDKIFDYPLLDSPPHASPLYAALCHVEGVGKLKSFEIEKWTIREAAKVNQHPFVFFFWLTINEIKEIPGIGQILAERIHVAFHGRTEQTTGAKVVD